MSLAATTTSVNCTSCGAGLDVLGGGRVMVHVCPYCGAELDAQDNYKVIAKFEGLKRPDSPFRIGMSGKIKGAEYTVIGTLEYTERYRGRTWTWVDHQLYSPTHGYAWLSVEDGHLVFTRRYRRPVWLSPARVERSDTPPVVRVDGRRFRYYETSSASITFAEGEFTWAPKIGDKTTEVTVLGDDTMLSFSETGSEREVYRSELLDSAETAASFGVTDPPVPQGVHPMQPFTGGENEGFMRKVALIAMVVCFALAMVFDGRTGQDAIPPITIPAADLPTEVPIEIPDVAGPVLVSLDGSPYVTPRDPARTSPHWARVSVDLRGPDGNRPPGVRGASRVNVGGQRQGAEPGVANHLEMLFPSGLSGSYMLHLSVDQTEPPMSPATGQAAPPAPQPGGQGQTGFQTMLNAANRQVQSLLGGNSLPFADGTITVHVQAGLSRGYWLYRLGWVFLLITGATYLPRFLHNRRRWNGSDWSED